MYKTGGSINSIQSYFEIFSIDFRTKHNLRGKVKWSTISFKFQDNDNWEFQHEFPDNGVCRQWKQWNFERTRRSHDEEVHYKKVWAKRDSSNFIAQNGHFRNAWGNLSYADLITQAIMQSPEKRLTLSQGKEKWDSNWVFVKSWRVK